MIAVAAALAPLFALIALGWVLRRFVFRAEIFWEAIESLTYFVLFPALLVVSIAGARIAGPTLAPVLGVLAGTMLAVALALLLLRRFLPVDGPAFTSIFQGSVRFNTYIGLAAAAALFGTPGVALIAVALALMIPLSNLLCVLVLARHAGGGGPGWTATAVALAANPLIIASAVGLALSLGETPLPPVVGPVLEILGRAALAVALLAVGAGLNLGAVATSGVALAVSISAKLVLSPLLAWAGCRLVGADALTTSAAVLFAALPPAPSAFVLARRLGGDHELMAATITVHTVLAALTLPAALALLAAG